MVVHFATATGGLRHHFTGTLSLRRLQFRRLARAANVVLILVAHHRKADGEHGDQISGSHQYGATIDGFIEMRRTAVRGQRKVSFEGRDWPEIPDEIVQIQDDLRLVYVGTSEELAAETEGERIEADVLAMLNVMPSGSLIPRDDLLDAVSMSDKRLRTAIKAGIASGRIVEEVLKNEDGKPLRGRPKGYKIQ